jgi:hypothetical protein
MCLMPHFEILPEREKGPDDPPSLSELFRPEEYMAGNPKNAEKA